MKKVIPTVQACVTVIVKNYAFDSMIVQYYVTFGDWFQLNDESLVMCQNMSNLTTRTTLYLLGTQLPIPPGPGKDSWLYRAKTAFSMCSGAGTAESSRAVLQRIVESFPLPGCTREMDIQTVALWESSFYIARQFETTTTYEYMIDRI